MTLVTAILARNEADKDLRAVLARCAAVSDQVLLLDDQSTDETVLVAREAGATVRRRTGKAAWGKEAPARAQLWAWGSEVAKDGWLLIADADQILVGDPRPLLDTWDLNTYCFVLYDLWAEDAYRADGYWQAHQVARPWLFCPSRVPPGWSPQWPTRGIHCGHCPQNWPMVAGILPPDILAWHHRAYLTPERRAAKHAQYRSQWDQLTEAERAHADSILT